MRMPLNEIWYALAKAGYETDKGSIHSYINIYEGILDKYRCTHGNVLEIGLFNGHSMRMWEAYFPYAKVHGIDCSETPHDGMADLRPMIAEGTHNIHILDATSEIDIRKEFRGMTFDVIIDDGNHHVLSQIHSYEILSPHLSDDSIYIIEDVADIDQHRELFEKIDQTKKITIIDNRHVKNRFDDVLVIITDK